jgi:hypothetical protein
VVRYRELDMVMEVLTVAGGGAWREIMPDPVGRFQIAVTVKGFMFWHLHGE